MGKNIKAKPKRRQPRRRRFSRKKKFMLPRIGVRKRTKLPYIVTSIYDVDKASDYSRDLIGATLFLQDHFPESCVVISSEGFQWTWSLGAFGEKDLPKGVKPVNLHIAPQMYKKLKKCLLDPSKRFVLASLYLSFKYYESGKLRQFDADQLLFPHQNFLVFDRVTNTVERFEPHGAAAAVDDPYDPRGLGFAQPELDAALRTLFLDKFGIQYEAPASFCPLIGWQSIQEDAEGELRKMGHAIPQGYRRGFCFMWSVFYAHMRLLNPDIPRSILQQQTINTIRAQPGQMTQFIIDYTIFHEKALVKRASFAKFPKRYRT